MNGPKGGNARLTALKMIASVLDQGQSLADTDGGGSSLSPRDRAFALHLAYGVLRWLSALEWLSAQLLSKPLKRKDRDIQRLICLGLYQLWIDQTAPHAAINETSECARKLKKPWAVGLVNAVLRRFQREREALLEALQQHDERLAHPAWLLNALRQDWPEDWTEIAAANNQAAPLWIRLNSRRDPAETLKVLTEAGFETGRHPYSTQAVRIEPARPVQQLPGFAEGRFSVQDPAAQLAPAILQPAAGHRVLDACAAPGGKTCHLLEACDDLELTALDRSAERMTMVRENLNRLGFAEHPGLKLRVADAADTGDWWDGQAFDRILLDAPCSASGVIRRHPEIKWLRNAEQVAEAARIQAILLDKLWPLLRTGGMLLYATCSVFRKENSLQVSSFLERHGDATPAGPDGAWGRDASPGRQILPGEEGMDGFYYALMRKTS